MTARRPRSLAAPTSRRSPLISLFGATLLAGTLAACGGDDGGSAEKMKCKSAETSAATALTVAGVDYAFEPAPLTAKAGTIEITFEPGGAQPHTFVISECSDAKLQVTAGGEPDSMILDLKPGSYEIICDVSGHRERGMVTKLTVT